MGVSAKGIKKDLKKGSSQYKRGGEACAREDSKDSPSHVEKNKAKQQQKRESERLRLRKKLIAKKNKTAVSKK